jgi:hypothetical protein
MELAIRILLVWVLIRKCDVYVKCQHSVVHRLSNAVCHYYYLPHLRDLWILESLAIRQIKEEQLQNNHLRLDSNSD